MSAPRGVQPAEPTAGARRGNLTGRAAALALVFCMLAISLAYPLREYLSQRAEISAYEARVAAQERRVAELEQARRRWQDPAYVRAQARDRLHFVMPGETQYVVIGPDDVPAAQPATEPSTRTGPQRPWFTRLWQSVESAGRS